MSFEELNDFAFMAAVPKGILDKNMAPDWVPYGGLMEIVAPRLVPQVA